MRPCLKKSCGPWKRVTLMLPSGLQVSSHVCAYLHKHMCTHNSTHNYKLQLHVYVLMERLKTDLFKCLSLLNYDWKVKISLSLLLRRKKYVLCISSLQYLGKATVFDWVEGQMGINTKLKQLLFFPFNKPAGKCRHVCLFHFCFCWTEILWGHLY